MTFLVVDDSSTMRRIIINTVSRLGHGPCVEANSGREGLERLAGGGIDVVITDWNMPGMSGLDLVRAIRSREATRHLPVLIVTTNAAKEDIVQALEAGVSAYVIKPFTFDVMKEKIQAALSRQQSGADDP